MRRRELMERVAFLGAASAVPACASEDEPPLPAEPTVFRHGVASGDPTPEAVILWTRVTSDDPAAVVEVVWIIATDPGMTEVVGSGTATTDSGRDFTLKLDATGLSPATTYYYRFEALGEASSVGRTRTAPEGAVDRLRFAVCSCASFGHGYYNAYRHLARRADLDVVIHLGDYLYEYAEGEYGDVRGYEPSHEIISLEDYRIRYALHRRDPDLQAVHRQHPFVVVWDDHESANNAWSDGAGNHDPSDGAWDARKAASRQAYFEWMPIREDGDQIQRVLRYGDLVDLIMLDTRLCCRDQQALDDDDPILMDPDRSLLGLEQEAWLEQQLSASTAQWKILGQQVMLGQLPVTNVDQWDGYPFARQRLLDFIAAEAISDVVVLTGDIHSSWAMDITPDPFDPQTYDPDTGSGSLAVELVAPGITSPGFPEQLASVADGFVADNPHMKWVEVTLNGYYVLDLTPARLQGSWYFVDTIEVRQDGEALGGAVEAASGTSHLVVIAEPDPPPDAAPPPAP